MTASAEPSRLLLRPEPLTGGAFAPFGTVLAHDAGAARSVNAGTAWRTESTGRRSGTAGPRSAMAIYRLAPQVLPLAVVLFERHPRSEQSFAALTVDALPRRRGARPARWAARHGRGPRLPRPARHACCATPSASGMPR